MDTTNPLRAGALILNNIEMFNEATILLKQQIEKKIFEEIQDIVGRWVQENDCDGEMEWVDGNENLWFTPRKWYVPAGEENLQFASFWFAYEDDDTDSYNVADLCGCGQTRMGFAFGMSWEQERKKGGKKAWKSACEALSEKSLQELESLGFRYQKNWNLWFLPITIDNAKLASAFENDDYDDAMEPLARALEAIDKSIPIFSNLVKQMEKTELGAGYDRKC